MPDNKISHWLTTPGKLTTEIGEYNRQCVDYAAQIDRLVEAAQYANTAISERIHSPGCLCQLCCAKDMLTAALRNIELPSNTKVADYIIPPPTDEQTGLPKGAIKTPDGRFLVEIKLESEEPKYRPYTPAEAVQFLGRTMIYSKYPTAKYHLIEVGLTHALIAGDQGYSSYENICKHYTWADTGEPCGMKEEA